MTGPIRVSLAIDHGLDQPTVEAALGAGDGVRIVNTISGLVGAGEAMANDAAELAVVACAGYGDHVSTFLKDAVGGLGGRPVIVLCEESPNGFVGDAFSAGADDIFVLPPGLGAEDAGALTAELQFTLRKAIARKGEAGGMRPSGVGELICVLGPKGGTGKTLTTCNLGVALAAAGHRVAIVDLDLQFGDVGLALGLTPEKTIYDLARSGGSLDPEKLDAFLTTHQSGARVLLAPTRPDQASVVTTDLLRDVYAVLRSTFDFVIVDTPPGFTPEVIASIDASSQICMVAMLDSLSLKNTKLGLETLELMGYDPDRVRFVLNRAGSRVGISGGDVESIAGRTIDFLVPSHRDVARSVSEGTPIVMSSRGSEVARAFRSLADTYVHLNGTHGQPQAPKRGRRLLRRRRKEQV